MEYTRDVSELRLFGSAIAVRGGTESNPSHLTQLKENQSDRVEIKSQPTYYTVRNMGQCPLG